MHAFVCLFILLDSLPLCDGSPDYSPTGDCAVSSQHGAAQLTDLQPAEPGGRRVVGEGGSPAAVYSTLGGRPGARAEGASSRGTEGPAGARPVHSSNDTTGSSGTA